MDGPGLYPDLTARDHLHMAAAYREVPRAACDEIVERLALGRYLDVRARALSQGNGQRLALALALLHRPKVLILDEPTNGMDPAGVVEIRDLLRGLADEGTTVFMSTHIVSEVERMADVVGIIHEGRMVDRAQPFTARRPGPAPPGRDAGLTGVSPPGACRVVGAGDRRDRGRRDADHG